MKEHDILRFNQEMRARTIRFSVAVYHLLNSVRLNDLSRIPARQLLRSSSSVASNFSAATRGRSDAEFYAKICIVTEECDETLFWISYMVESGILTTAGVAAIQKEALELLCIFSSIKKKMKLRLNINKSTL